MVPRRFRGCWCLLARLPRRGGCGLENRCWRKRQSRPTWEQWPCTHLGGREKEVPCSPEALWRVLAHWSWAGHHLPVHPGRTLYIITSHWALTVCQALPWVLSINDLAHYLLRWLPSPHFTDEETEAAISQSPVAREWQMQGVWWRDLPALSVTSTKAYFMLYWKIALLGSGTFWKKKNVFGLSLFLPLLKLLKAV